MNLTEKVPTEVKSSLLKALWIEFNLINLKNKTRLNEKKKRLIEIMNTAKKCGWRNDYEEMRGSLYLEGVINYGYYESITVGS